MIVNAYCKDNSGKNSEKYQMCVCVYISYPIYSVHMKMIAFKLFLASKLAI